MQEGRRRTDCIHDSELVARHEAALAKLTQTLADFIERSAEDRRAISERYFHDKEEAIAWRNEMRTRMELIESFISSLKPDHKLLMVLAMGIIIGSATLIWRMLWTHIGSVK